MNRRILLTFAALSVAALPACDNGSDIEPIERPSWDTMDPDPYDGDPWRGRTREELAEEFDATWYDEILVSNDVILLDDSPCLSRVASLEDDSLQEGELLLAIDLLCSPEATGIEEGNIIVKTGDLAFGHRIQTIDQAGYQVQVLATKATFNEMFVHAEWRHVITYPVETVQLMEPAESGDENADERFIANLSVTLWQETIGLENYKLRAGARFDVRPTATFSGKIDPCWWPPLFICGAEVSIDVSLESDYDVYLEPSFALGITKSGALPIPNPFPVYPFAFAIGPVPVQGVLKLNTDLTWKVQAMSRISTKLGITGSSMMMVGVSAGTSGFQARSGTEFSMGIMEPEFDLDSWVLAKMGLRFRLTAEMYVGLFDVWGAVEPYGQARADLDCNEVELALQYGVGTSIGASFGIGPFTVNGSVNTPGLGPYNVADYVYELPFEGPSWDPDCETEDEGLGPDYQEPTPPTLLTDNPDWFNEIADEHAGAIADSLEDLEEEDPTDAELNEAVIYDLALAPDGASYWTVNADGVVEAYGAAGHYGNGTEDVTATVHGIVAHPSGTGYWLFTSAGRVHDYGSAEYHGDTVGTMVEAGFMDMAATASGNGYWLLAADGVVRAYGDAPLAGSATLEPGEMAVGIAPTPSGNGYWVASSQGNVYPFGDASDLGGPATSGAGFLPSGIVWDIESVPGSQGYWTLKADGDIDAYGSATPFSFDRGDVEAGQIMGMSVTPSGQGLLIVARGGEVFSVGNAPYVGN